MKSYLDKQGQKLRVLKKNKLDKNGLDPFADKAERIRGPYEFLYRELQQTQCSTHTTYLC